MTYNELRDSFFVGLAEETELRPFKPEWFNPDTVGNTAGQCGWYLKTGENNGVLFLAACGIAKQNFTKCKPKKLKC